MKEPRRIAVLVEDEAQVRRFIRSALEQEQWQVFEASPLNQGLVECGTRRPDVVLLDLGLPDGDGIRLIRDLRAWSQVPIIVVSARSEERQKIATLDAGADDYLTKPFGIRELLARVRVAIRRLSDAPEPATTQLGDVVIDFSTRTVTRQGKAVHLTPTEYRLLAVMAAHAGKVLTYRHLLREVWGPTHVDRIHYLRTYMATIRAKLEENPARPNYFLTITAVGYQLQVPD